MTASINLAGVFVRLNRLLSQPLAPWLAIVAKREHEKVAQRIRETKLTPDGQSWEPWAQATEIRRIRKGNADRGLLYNEGLLLASIIHRSSGFDAEIGVSSAVPYAGPLQDGTSRMAARPYLGWNAPSLALLELDAAIYLSKLLR